MYLEKANMKHQTEIFSILHGPISPTYQLKLDSRVEVILQRLGRRDLSKQGGLDAVLELSLKGGRSRQLSLELLTCGVDHFELRDVK